MISASASPSPAALTCTIEGTKKVNKLVGGSGDDVICGLGGDDILKGGPGNDTLIGGLGDDSLEPGSGEDVLDGGPGRDVADYADSKEPVDANLRSGSIEADGNDLAKSIEQLIGSAFNDILEGSAGDDVIVGGAGKDKISGSKGIDICAQGPGKGKVSCERSFEPVPFAKVGKLTIMVPARDPMLLAYHESLFKSAAAMKPVGDKKDWLIQPSRGRGTPATSAIDIPLQPGTDVLAPVDGVVIDVIEYPLYCEALDHLVVIRPFDDRDVSVVVMHLVEVQVKKGDEVYAGGTVLGEPHVFPGGTNQVDNYVPGSPPHVHIEVEEDGSKVIPGCDYKRTTEDKKKS